MLGRCHRRYLEDLKACVVYQSEILKYSATKIAIELDMSLHVVQCTLQHWKEIGDVVLTLGLTG
jgi:hypothetical protein